ncbi:MAG: AAA family ATPase [Bacteroidota bacterium]
MIKLIEKSSRKINTINNLYNRFLLNKVNWNHKLISILGSRGVGKTTLLLQYLKQLQKPNHEVLYVSMDDIYFTNNLLVDLVNEFVKHGGKILALDEVHKYPNWSREVKNIYDDYRDLQIIITGSSLLEIKKGDADLSRRSVDYILPTLSFREFIMFENNTVFPAYTLSDILNSHEEIAKEINQKVKPLFYYQKFIKSGAYPFFIDAKEEFSGQLLKTIHLLLESDLISVLNIDYSHIIKLKKLLLLISESVPFKPNISELSSKVGITRDSVMNYFEYLQKAHLIFMLCSANKGFRRFEKPEKIYLNDCNQLFAISSAEPNIGTIRETFFLQHLNAISKLNYTESGDFLVDEKFIFEIGGKNKSFAQIKDLSNSFIAADSIEYGLKNKIPLWMFGFVY